MPSVGELSSMSPLLSVAELLCFSYISTTNAKQFYFNIDFTAKCFSRIGGYDGSQDDYNAHVLSNTLFDGRSSAGDITITGTDYFLLQINFNAPVDVKCL